MVGQQADLWISIFARLWQLITAAMPLRLWSSLGNPSLSAALFQNSTDFMATLNRLGEIQAINPAGLALLGLDTVPVGAPFSSLFCPDAQRYAENQILPVAQHTGTWQGETRLQQVKTHQAVTMDLSLFMVAHPKTGKPCALGCIGRDLTHRKRTEQALAQSEAQFRCIMDSDMMGILIWDLDGRVVDANNAFLQMVGYTREDLEAGRVNWQAMTPDEYMHQDTEIIAGMRQQGYSGPFEKQYLTKTGQRVDVLVSTSFWRDSETQGVAFVVNISSQKQLERNLKTMQERFYLVQCATNDAIWDWNMQTDQVSWNDGLEILLRYAPESVAPTAHWRHSRIHPEDRPRVLDSIEQAKATGTPFWTASYRFATGDDTYISILDRGYLVFNQDGQAMRMVGSMMSHQAALAYSEYGSPTALAELARQEKSAFLAGLSHQLRTHLNAILGYSDMLHHQRFSNPDRHQQYLAHIHTSSHTLLTLANNLMDLSRIEAGQFLLCKSAVNLMQVLHETSRRVTADAAPRNLHISIDIGTALPLLFADPQRLKQILATLLTRLLEIVPSQSQLTLSCTRHPQQQALMVHVTHTGPSVDNPRRQTLLQTLAPCEVNTDRALPADATSLDLLLARQLVRLHHGTLTANLTGNEVLEITVTLPASLAQPYPADDPALSPEEASQLVRA